MPNQEDQQEEEEEEDEEGRNVVCMCETVCVFCVLLWQTATLNVLLQTAQFQHLQSPRTEHPKQRFFFSILHKYLLLTWVLQFAHWVLTLMGNIF